MSPRSGLGQPCICLPDRHVHLTIFPYTNYSRPIAYSIKKKPDQNTKT